MSDFNAEVALAQFNERKTENEKKKKVDNSALPAGSPMYYYCRFCGAHTETLPEAHVSRPVTVCDPCEALHKHGLI